MMIRFGCPACKSTLEAPERKAGDKIACLKCGQRLQIPFPIPNKTVLAPFLGTIGAPSQSVTAAPPVSQSLSGAPPVAQFAPPDERPPVIATTWRAQARRWKWAAIAGGAVVALAI